MGYVQNNMHCLGCDIKTIVFVLTLLSGGLFVCLGMPKLWFRMISRSPWALRLGSYSGIGNHLRSSNHSFFVYYFMADILWKNFTYTMKRVTMKFWRFPLLRQTLKTNHLDHAEIGVQDDIALVVGPESNLVSGKTFALPPLDGC